MTEPTNETWEEKFDNMRYMFGENGLHKDSIKELKKFISEERKRAQEDTLIDVYNILLKNDRDISARIVVDYAQSLGLSIKE